MSLSLLQSAPDAPECEPCEPDGSISAQMQRFLRRWRNTALMALYAVMVTGALFSAWKTGGGADAPMLVES